MAAILAQSGQQIGVIDADIPSPGSRPSAVAMRRRPCRTRPSALMRSVARVIARTYVTCRSSVAKPTPVRDVLLGLMNGRFRDHPVV